MRFRVLGDVTVEEMDGSGGQPVPSAGSSRPVSPPPMFVGSGPDEARLAPCRVGIPVRVPGRRERQVLAMLLAPVGAVATADELIDQLWDGSAPGNARRTIASNISRLRSVLDPRPASGGKPGTGDARPRSVITAVGDGWRLDVDAQDVDALVFGDRAQLCLDAMRRGHLVEARMHGEAALALWGGVPFRGYHDLVRCAAQAVALERLRRDVSDALVDVGLAQGAARELIAPLEASVTDDPLDERHWTQLVLAHYRSGDQAAALQTYRRARRVLTEELGVEPGAALRRLHRDVLNHADTLTLDSYALPAVGVGDGSEPRAATVCPFKGLAPYAEDDAGQLIGRDRPLAKALAMLGGEGVVALTGPSGNGKTSLVLAGLVPAVRGGAIAGSERWPVSVMTPGESPLGRLSAVDRHEAHGPNAYGRVGNPAGEGAVDGGLTGGCLLVVDQFEELFTLCPDRAQRQAFVDALLARMSSGTRLVLGMRSDFWAELGPYARLADRAVAASVFLGPLGEDDVRMVVREGARRAGLTCDDNLVEAVVVEAANQPGILPHLSTALVRTWDRRSDGRLHLGGYEQAGGIVGALADGAEEVWASLPDEQQRAARRVLLRLTTEDRDGRIVRRRLPADALTGDDPAASAAVQALVAARLLVVADDGFEVTHEALLTGWPRLAKWLEEDADARRTRRVVEDAARIWLEGDCLSSDLLRGPRLVGALHLLEDEPDLLDETAHEFLDASRDASLDEAQRARVDAARERRTSRRLRTLLASAVVLLVLSGVGGGVAVRSRTLAEQARVESLAASLGAQALVERRPDRALLLATEAVKLSPGSRTELALLTTLQRVARALTVTNLGARTVTSALSPNGRVLAVASNVGDLWLLDADTLAVRAKLRDADGRTMPRVLFLSDRELLYVVNKDASVGSELLVRDVSTPKERLVARLDDVWRLEASPDRSLLTATAALATATLTRRPDGTYAVQKLPLTKNLTNVATDGSYARLDEATGRLELIRPAARKGARPAGSAAAGGSVVSSVSGVPQGASIELSPDGRTFAVADNANGTIHLLDPATGRRLGDLAGEPGLAEDLAFSPDGRLLAAGGDTGTITLWDVAARTRTQTLAAGEEVVSLLFSPDGSVLYSTSMDGTNTRWDTTGWRGFGTTARLPVPTAYQGWDQLRLAGPMLAVLPADGTVVAVGGDGLVLLDPTTLAVRARRLTGITPSSLALSGDGTRLAVTTTGGKTVLVDPRTWSVTATIPGLSDVAYAAWDENASQLAIIEPSRRRLTVHDPTGRTLQTVPLPGEPYQVKWSANRVVASMLDGRVAVIDATTARIHPVLTVPGAVAYFPSIAVLPDGTLVTGARDGSIQRWALDTGTPLSPPNRVQPASMITQLAALPDGHVIVGGGVGALIADPTQAATPPARLYGTSASWIAVDTPRRRVITWDSVGSISAWDLDRSDWLGKACSLLGPPPSRQRWEELLGPEIPYAPACPQPQT